MEKFLSIYSIAIKYDNYITWLKAKNMQFQAVCDPDNTLMRS